MRHSPPVLNEIARHAPWTLSCTVAVLACSPAPTWHQETQPAFAVNGLWGGHDGRVFAAGDTSSFSVVASPDAGILVRSTAGTWSMLSPPGDGSLDAIGGTPSSLVVNDNQNVYVSMNDGQSWTAASMPSTGLSDNFLGIAPISATDSENLFAAGFVELFHSSNAGASWQIVPLQGSPVSPAGIWGTGSDLFMTTGGGALLRSRDLGATWASEQVGANVATAVWGSSATDVYVAGDAIYHSTGDGAWAQQWITPAPGSGLPALHAIWGSGRGDIYAVGAGGMVLHSTGNGSWEQQEICAGGCDQLNAIWGSSASDVYVAGSAINAGQFAGLVLHLHN